MSFNTAIFYDIENLIGGYGKADMLSNLSLKDIYKEIQKKEIGKIAIQRAYANWSDPRLNILRGDIIELGIEPIQMFGFGRGPQHNASDIQLAIDAIDTVYTRKAIETFVIVSGDGGFSALAKKLHEYGCMVIGCAYRRTTNRIFEAVCDDFVWIDEPKDDDIAHPTTNGFSDPIVQLYARKNQPIKANRDESFKEAVKILNFLGNNSEAVSLLKNSGLNISVLSQALTYRIVNFNFVSLGFIKFVDFIRYVTNGSRIKLVYSPPSEYRLLFRDCSIKGFVEVEPLTELSEIHSIEHYKNLLSRGAPVFRLPNRDVILCISQHLSENRIDYNKMLVGDIIDKISLVMDYDINDIKNGLFSFVHAGCFTKTPETAKLSEQYLSFVPISPEQTINMLKDAMHRKLQELLGTVDEDIFAQIMS